MPSPRIAALIAWLIGIGFFGFIGAQYIMPHLIELRDLAKSNRLIYGKIIETYPQIHSTCKYQYLVNGRIYEHVGKSCGNAYIDQPISVYFSPANPDISVNRDPNALFINDLIPFGLALLILPAFAAIATYRRARRN
jgi:hypothetical protein